MKMANVCGAALMVCAGSVASAQLYSNRGGTANPSEIGLASGPTTRSGVAAPAGSQWSELDLGNTNNGSTVSISGTTGIFRLTDDFTVPAGQSWTLSSVLVYAYRTGSLATDNIAASGNVRVWSGRPDDVGSTVIFGDTTTNRLLGQTNTNLFRVFGTTAAPGGTATPPGTTRIVRQLELDLGGIVLLPGTYWVDYQLGSSTTGAIFNPTQTTTDGSRGFVTGSNARQMTTATTWADVVDAGSPATLPDVPNDLPFILNGVPTPGSLCLLGLGGLLAARRRR